MKNLKTFEGIIVQIATPYCTGIGFYIKKYDLIITNEHLVRGNKKVAVFGKLFDHLEAQICYLDSVYNIAFIQMQDAQVMPEIEINWEKTPQKNEKVASIALKNGGSFYTQEGHILEPFNSIEQISYIKHNAALNPSSSGSPLVDINGMVIGINTFIIQHGISVGYTMPTCQIKKLIFDFLEGQGRDGVRCQQCLHINFENSGIVSSNCVNCGTPIAMISQMVDFEPSGICRTVEDMIYKLGFSPVFTRRGLNNWSIRKGSAVLNISYYEKTGLLIGDVYVCVLPNQGLEALYEYLLAQNNNLEAMAFSIKDQDIILSLLIYDQFLNVETMYKLFDKLLVTADKYDNLLVDQFGASWNLENQLFWK